MWAADTARRVASGLHGRRGRNGRVRRGLSLYLSVLLVTPTVPRVAATVIAMPIQRGATPGAQDRHRRVPKHFSSGIAALR
jgi:hypothetical protein